ncbi:MAG: 5-(carboxyamino)imidazole ribonucleotide mutase [Deferribacteraceae bacterium]|jgi:5-(carboxyamino)imidazole ribonucleotide mutase|nr:5-(carboxyamino)imidazole ribonucleotide mutase [Deferribacteraceae bacterium]
MSVVGIIIGSKSDFDIAGESVKMLKKFGVQSDVVISSAHRSPENTSEWSKNAKEKGYSVIIAFAGAAAHLAGVVASETNIPVVAVPISATSLSGLDALLSMVQMPGGVPVAVMAIGKSGAVNAAIFACQIIALKEPEMYEKLNKYRDEMRRKLSNDNEELKAILEKL